MIYEVRSYLIKPRETEDFVKIFAEAYEKRKEYSELAAFFITEVGPLNQVIHIWPYQSAAERDHIRTEAVNAGIWPPKGSDHILDMKSEIFTPFAYDGDFGTGDLGPLFEWREYTLNPGKMPGVMKAWKAALGERRKVSPFVFAMQTDSGVLNKFVHIWGYKSFEHRAEVRADTVSKGIWPPKGSPQGSLRYQENKLCLAAPFSPLQ